MKKGKHTVLIIENPQIDFFMGGAMEVPQAESILPILNQWIPKFDTIFVTMDWHPANHVSFAATHLWRQIGQIIDRQDHPIELKPIHCVQHTFGAKIHPQLTFPIPPIEIHKGTQATIEDDTAFQNVGSTTTLTAQLKEMAIKEIYVAGLVLEDNILKTALVGRKLGFSVSLISDASAGRLTKDGKTKLIAYLKSQGIEMV